jgi:hypothetical protein
VLSVECGVFGCEVRLEAKMGNEKTARVCPSGFYPLHPLLIYRKLTNRTLNRGNHRNGAGMNLLSAAEGRKVCTPILRTLASVQLKTGTWEAPPFLRNSISFEGRRVVTDVTEHHGQSLLRLSEIKSLRRRQNP